ncbi:ribonuclease H-like domain-containing protein [Tanacetum coccineum]
MVATEELRLRSRSSVLPTGTTSSAPQVLLAEASSRNQTGWNNRRTGQPYHYSEVLLATVIILQLIAPLRGLYLCMLDLNLVGQSRPTAPPGFQSDQQPAQQAFSSQQQALLSGTVQGLTLANGQATLLPQAFNTMTLRIPTDAIWTWIRCLGFSVKGLLDPGYDFYSDVAARGGGTRLVANGKTLLTGIDVDETFSPVVNLATIRTVLSLALSRHWPRSLLGLSKPSGMVSEDLQHYADRVGFLSKQLFSSEYYCHFTLPSFSMTGYGFLLRFLRVGTTLDIFHNITLIPYLEYGVLSPLDTAY